MAQLVWSRLGCRVLWRHNQRLSLDPNSVGREDEQTSELTSTKNAEHSSPLTWAMQAVKMPRFYANAAALSLNHLALG
jgi:hypothetical protein